MTDRLRLQADYELQRASTAAISKAKQLVKAAQGALDRLKEGKFDRDGDWTTVTARLAAELAALEASAAMAKQLIELMPGKESAEQEGSK